MRFIPFLTTVILPLGIIYAAPEPGLRELFGKKKELGPQPKETSVRGVCKTIGISRQAFCHVKFRPEHQENYEDEYTPCNLYACPWNLSSCSAHYCDEDKDGKDPGCKGKEKGWYGNCYKAMKSREKYRIDPSVKYIGVEAAD